MKRLLFVALMMVCLVSWAEWKSCSKGESSVTYCDKSTIRKNGAISRMWELEDYLSVKTAAAGDRYKSAKTFWAYNCREETKALTSFIMYSGSMGEGEAVFTFTVQERNWEWTPVAPGTSGETTWKIACGKE